MEGIDLKEYAKKENAHELGVSLGIFGTDKTDFSSV
jgi:hypothetical protein